MIGGQSLDMTAQEQSVLAVLANHCGRDQAIPLVELAEACGSDPRETQTVVKHLIEWHGQSIGSATGANHGYFLIESAEDQEQAEQQLRNRIIHTAQRLAKLKRNTPDHVLGQIAMDLSQEGRHADVP